MTGNPGRGFLKWAGGKFDLIDHIRAVMPNGRVLIEPFAGSGAVFVNTNFDKNILADTNRDLISIYSILQRHGAQFIVDASELFVARNNSEKRYYSFRNQFNSSHDDYERALLFLYLNRHCYNGLCRYNQSGQFNVPFGRFKSARFPDIELHKFYIKSKLATFICEDFETTMKRARKNHIVYADPPYVPLSDTANFTSFTAEKFNMEKQKQLAECAKKASARGATVLISNHDTPFTRKLYAGAEIRSFSARRRISRDGANRNPVKELIAIYAAK